MSEKSRPTYRELADRLATSEPIVEALKHLEVDAVVGNGKIAFLLLRKVEAALLESTDDFRAMFDLPGIGMIHAETPALRFTRVNQKFCEIAGYSQDELLTKTYIDLTHPEDRPRDMKLIARVLRSKADSWSIEKRCVRKDGSVVWVCVDGAAQRDDAGRTVRVVAMVSDVTARRQADPAQHNAGRSSVAKPAPKRRKSASVKRSRKSTSSNVPEKPRSKRR